MASSCIVIWKQPSPSMLTTVSSGNAICAPIAAGTPKPIVPRPPEVIAAARLLDLQPLRRPHLVLADARRPDHVAVGEQVAEALHHVLRLQRADPAVAERVLEAPLLDLVAATRASTRCGPARAARR